ncbi:unnamed protein product [Cylindrotheca closterium]|uniref:Globin domain-containing protein n=1 Tax=Cylindrotheca closterium TaxID=2856 RepID=A0AAD2FXG5_9STRA|nr:unnamed protein product [Cylindrotheca closterium]
MEVYCASIEKAVESWKLIQSDPNYYVTFGEALFRRIFEIAPAAVSLFHFAPEGKRSETVQGFESSPKFHPHAKAVLLMLEQALMLMLESQLYDLAEALSSLGLRHLVYGVGKEHFKVLETAVLDTLELFLPHPEWTKCLQKDWQGVLHFICKGMIVGADQGFSIKRKKRELGELSVATLRLQPTPSNSNDTSAPIIMSPPPACGSRFDLHVIKSPKDPPKPAMRSRFENFFEDSLPQTPKRSSMPKRNNSDPVLKTMIPSATLRLGRGTNSPAPTVTPSPSSSTTQRNNQRRRRHTSTDLLGEMSAVQQRIDRLSFPSDRSLLDKSSSSTTSNPTSLLSLRNELCDDIGLGPTAGRPIRKHRMSRSHPKRPLSVQKHIDTALRILNEQEQQEEPMTPNNNNNNNKTNDNSTSMTFEQLDASTSTWPILGLEQDPPSTLNTSWPMLGLEQDATPVLPRRQVSPKPIKKKKKKTITARPTFVIIDPSISVDDTESPIFEPLVC